MKEGKDTIQMCGPRPQAATVKVSENGVPVLQPGAINVYAIMPCPLKVRFKSEFQMFIDQVNSLGATPIYCPTILDGSPKNVEALMKSAVHESELPEVLVTTSFGTIFSERFKKQFLETGIYEGVTKDEFFAALPDEYKRVSKQYNIGFLAFGSWSLICDMSLATDMIFPRSWTDLAKPEFKNLLSIHGYQGKASGTSLLLVLKERLGPQAINCFAQNIKEIKHFAEIIKRIDSTDEDRTPFNILPNAASVQMPSRKRATMLEFSDGPLMAPLMIFVKKSKRAESQDVLDFFWSQTFREVLERGDFFMPNQMDWTQNYTFPSWDFLASQDFDELSESLNAEFSQSMQKP